MAKIHLILKPFKYHIGAKEFCYKLRIKGRKSTVINCPDPGKGADFRNTAHILLKSN